MKEANFFWGVGRRKTAVARTRVMSGSGKITINDRELDTYCYTEELVRAALAPLMTVGMRDSIDVHVNVNGGGPNGQSGAIAMGIARALQRMDPELRQALKAAGHLRRDPRMRERKKVGQPGARKRFQFSKR
ncbi:MAG TPA: 30S ribosomal protein S9 [Opitutales bacterium]|nr:30S ribosomal protein S9 [Opitutales bacterium]